MDKSNLHGLQVRVLMCMGAGFQIWTYRSTHEPVNCSGLYTEFYLCILSILSYAPLTAIYLPSKCSEWCCQLNLQLVSFDSITCRSK